jgi:cell wall-associated NlpC family hydrolase
VPIVLAVARLLVVVAPERVARWVAAAIGLVFALVVVVLIALATLLLPLMAGVVMPGDPRPPGAPTTPMPPGGGPPPPPAELDAVFREVAERTGVPACLLRAIAAIESGYNPMAVGPALPQFAGTEDEHALGMMQFLPSTYRALLPRVDGPAGTNHPMGMAGVWEPRHAVYAAAFYLRDHGAPGDLDRAVYAYYRDWAYVRRVLDGTAACEAAGAGPLPIGGEREAAIVAAAQRALGAPYWLGGDGDACPAGRRCFDCSGLVWWAYREAGLDWPRLTAHGQWARYGVGRLPFAQMRPGDMVFFEGTSAPNPGERITHVGLYVGLVDGRPTMIDAPEAGKPVRYSRLDSEYWQAHYAGNGRWR